MKHELTKEIQGEYSYVIGPCRDPVLTVKSGDTVVAHTVDAFEQKSQTRA